MSNNCDFISQLSQNVRKRNDNILSPVPICRDIGAFKYMSEQKYLKINGDRGNQCFLMHCAAASGDLKLLKWVIKNLKCHTTDLDPDGLSILHVACLTANLEIVKWLLQFTHLSPKIRTHEGATCLHFAAWSGTEAITMLLLNHEPRLLNMRMINGSTAAMFATQGGFINLMKLLLHEGANFGIPTVDGFNCLHIAAQQGKLDAMKWLVDNVGIRLKTRDSYGATPLYYARINNHHDVVKWLIEKEVKVFKGEVGNQNFFSEEKDNCTEKAVEEIEMPPNMISVSRICGLSALDFVHNRINKVLTDLTSGLIQREKNGDVDMLGRCIVSRSILTLLQSALSDIQLQCPWKKMSNETQTSLPGLEKMMTSVGSQTDKIPIFEDIQPFAIPPPHPPPPIIDSSSQIEETQIIGRDVEKRTTHSKASTHHRREPHKDIRVSLIDELKQKNRLRSKIEIHEYVSSDSSESKNKNYELVQSLNIKNVPNTLHLSKAQSDHNENVQYVVKSPLFNGKKVSEAEVSISQDFKPALKSCTEPIQNKFKVKRDSEGISSSQYFFAASVTTKSKN